MSTDPDASAEFEIAGPYDFDRTVAFLRTGPADPTFIRESGSIWRAWLTPDGPATLTIRCEGSVLTAKAWGPGAERAIGQAPRLGGLHDDPSVFQPTHPVLARLVKVHPGLRLPDTGDVYGALIRTIPQQLITWVEATEIWRDLVRHGGEPAPGPRPLMVPPSPQSLARVPMWRLQRLGLPTNRCNTLKLVGRHANRLNEAYAMSRPDRLRRLQAIPGIGPWTAESVLGMHLGDADAIMPGDVHLPRMVHFALTGENRAVTDDEMIASMERFSPHRFRALQLMHAANLKPPRTSPKREVRKRYTE